MTDDREQLQDPELQALIDRGEELPDDETEFASPPPEDEADPESRVTPDEPS